jgi:L-methionine (R)-S-oxide reductase
MFNACANSERFVHARHEETSENSSVAAQKRNGMCTFALMAENLFVAETTDKQERYLALLPQLQALMDPKAGATANVANAMAALKQTFGWLWIGVYMVQDDHLELGPFQGPIACTRIEKGKGVCGSAWNENRTLVVPDVEAFPGHIACSSASRSEIVVPIQIDGQCIGVIDADSERLDDFDTTDQDFLERISEMLSQLYV